MISNKTLLYTISAANCGSVVRLSPFFWDPALGIFKSSPKLVVQAYGLSYRDSWFPRIVSKDLELRSWKLTMYFSVWFKFVLIAYWIIFIIAQNYETSLEEKVLLVFLSSNCLTALCVQIMYISSHDEIVDYINTLLIFDRRLGGTFGLNTVEKDGLEPIARLVLVVPLVVTVLIVPAVYTILGLNWRILVHLSQMFSRVWYGRLLASCLFSLLAAMDWYYVLLFWLIAMLYQNSIFNWFCFQKTWLEKKSKNTCLCSKARTTIIYRGHQIIHTISTNLANNMLPLTLVVAVFLITTTLICFIRMWRTGNVFFLAVVLLVGGTTTFILKAVTRTSAGISELSAAYSKSFQCNETRLNKIDRRFLRSCPTLKWKVGRSFQICKNTFGIIMFGTVIDWVINLLLTF